MRFIVRYIVLYYLIINEWTGTCMLTPKMIKHIICYPYKNLETYTSDIIFVMSGSLTTVQNINHYTGLNTAL